MSHFVGVGNDFRLLGSDFVGVGREFRLLGDEFVEVGREFRQVGSEKVVLGSKSDGLDSKSAEPVSVRVEVVSELLLRSQGVAVSL